MPDAALSNLNEDIKQLIEEIRQASITIADFDEPDSNEHARDRMSVNTRPILHFLFVL